MAFIGPFSSQSLRRKAIQFIMIVFTTSCAPNLAFRKPGIAPQTAPASCAAQEGQRQVDEPGQAGDAVADKCRSPARP